MKQRRLGFLAIIMAFAVLGPSCQKTPSGSSSSLTSSTESSSAPLLADGIISAPSTRKIRLKEEIDYSKGVDLSLSLCKREKEGIQLVFSPKETCYYDVTVSDLIKGNDKIPASDVEVYREHYLNVTKTSEPNPVLGYYPDPLVPLALSKSKGENIVSSGDNQAILIEVESKEETVAGDYEGTVTLKLGEESHSYPFKVKVEDITLPKTHKAWRAFALWESEYNAAYHTTDGSEEYMNNAANLLLNYGISPTNVPGISGLSTSEQVEKIATYAAKEDVTCFSLPYSSRSYSVVGHGSYYTADFSQLEDLLRSLIGKSTDDFNILSKTYLYITTLDEQKPENYWRVIDSNARFRNLKDTLIADSSLWSGKEKVKASLDKMEHVVTMTQSDPLYDSETQSGLYTACPLYSILDNVEYLTSMKQRMNNGNSYWWYGCTTPVSPYPTYHIDDDLLAAREVSWMQKQYGISGELYWCSNINSSFNSEFNVYLARDCWQDGSSDHGSGDGWLIYPGNRYGTKESFPSLRLMAIRDGIEDYDLLSVLEEKYGDAKAKYGLDEDFSEYMKGVYSLIINGVHHLDDDSAFDSARSEVISLINSLSSGSNSLISVKKNPKTNHSIVTVHSSEGTSLSVNGKDVTSSSCKGGLLFETDVKSVNDSEASLSLSFGGVSSTVSKRIGGYAKMIASFDDGIQGVSINPYKNSGIAMSANSDIAYAESGGSLHLSLSYVDRLSYKPTARLSLAELGFANGLDASGYTNIALSLCNASSEDIGLTVYLSDSTMSSMSVAYSVLPANGWTSINSLLILSGINIASLTEIRLSFNNSSVARDVYIDNIYLEGGAS